MKKGFAIWMTGLSGAGKSTLAVMLARRFRERGTPVEVLDGDEVRQRLSRDLGFSKADRDEHIRRVAFVCEVLIRHHIVVIVAAISPYRALREQIRLQLSAYVEIYVECPIDVVVKRDVKGLYHKAISGAIAHFTGISDPYEPPSAPEGVVNTSHQTPEQSLEQVWTLLQELGLVPLDHQSLDDNQ
jgi:adenylyl-sulfate kinase